jgi:trehalose-6-phosphate synthase
VDIIVSNRVARIEPDSPTTGGLAAALLPAVRRSGVVWFGSSGRRRRIAPGTTPLIQIESNGRGTLATVDVPEQHHTRFYEGFANLALWPAAALLMSREERCGRWQNMMDVLLRHSIHAWFAFMQALKTSRPSPLIPAKVSLPATAGRVALAHPRR